jgi:hypothetical protein
MASTAMRLVIIAARAGAFYALIVGCQSKFPLFFSFFQTQGCARPAPACPTEKQYRGLPRLGDLDTIP